MLALYFPLLIPSARMCQVEPSFFLPSLIIQVYFYFLTLGFIFQLIYSILLDVFPCMDYSSLYFLKNVFTFTTVKINFLCLDLNCRRQDSVQKVLLFSFPSFVLCFLSFSLITMFSIFASLFHSLLKSEKSICSISNASS